jgi:hypothetical protein
MAERRQIDHEQLLQLSRTILLLAERQQLLLKLNRAEEEDKKVIPIEGFSRASWGWGYPMPRVGQFCPSNIARLLLGIFIIVTLLIAIGFWLYHSPGHGTLIEQPTHYPAPNKWCVTGCRPQATFAKVFMS